MSLIKIKDLFHFEKGILQSSKCIPGEYDFITASSEWKTNNEFTHDCEALIFAAAASGSLGRTHYVNGKFVSSDLCFIITAKDPINFPIDLKFYHMIFNEFKNDIVNSTKKGTSKEAIGMSAFGNYELPYFGFEKQIETKNQFVDIQKSKLGIFSELTHQLDLVKQLRQSFLREAMQGKLLAKAENTNITIPPAKAGGYLLDDNATFSENEINRNGFQPIPNDSNPIGFNQTGQQLLEKIKAEKAQLIAEKKIKKEQPLAPISEKEIPFEIPEHWVWCRLGEVVNEILGGYAFDSTRYSKNETENQVIRLGNVKFNRLVLETGPVFIDGNYANEVEKALLKNGDVLITMTGTRAKRDYLFSLCITENDLTKKNLYLNQRVGCFRFPSLINNDFINIALKEIKLLEPIFESSTGAANQANIGITALKEMIIPLPPIHEQEQIVTKLEELMGFCDGLEQSIKQSQGYNEMLLQQVLREALQGEEV
jgi:type I restriction enzyme S subunit